MLLVFSFIGIYLIPIIGFLFIITLLAAIQKITYKRPYKREGFWSAFFFAILVWTICVCAQGELFS